MLGSVAAEVAIGLVFCYASMAVISSAIYEAGASLLKLRARTLLAGVKDLLNDPHLTGLARDLYRHALVNPRATGAKDAPASSRPSYIEPRAFARALIEGVQQAPAGIALARADLEQVPDEQLRTLLLGMFDRAEGKLENFEQEVARWFDSGMDRVSGSYKRQAQLFTFVIALLLAGLFNVDTFHLFRTLWQHPAAAATVAAAGSQAGDVTRAIGSLNALPIGWTDATPCLPLMVCGWLVTALSALFGAPFWFDLLQRITNLRGTGPKPTQN